MGHSWMASLLLLAFAVSVDGATLETLRDENGKPYRYAGRLDAGPVRIPVSYQPKAGELRGVWIATVENIDFGTHTDAASFQRDFRNMLQALAGKNFNAVFFQVRPNNDAFYPSRLNPWSRWLTGQEGKRIPGFDPLKFMTEEARRRGMEFHAWLNPYRVIGKTKLSKSAYLATLAPENFARRHPELVLEAPLSGGQRLLFLDPGRPEVIQHVIATVSEIAQNYDVDGIHFDDYFYPYSEFGNIDATTFRQYNPRKLALADWRRANVTRLVAGVHEELAAVSRRKGRKVRFGISPFGIWANRKNHPEGSLTAGKQSYFAQFADTRGWVRNRYIDYIAPQIYWPFGHEVAAYAALADWWAEQVRGTGVSLYIGMGAYQLGGGKIWQNPSEIANQLRYNTKHPEINGAIFFSCRSVLNPSNAKMREGLERVFRNYWSRPAAAAPMMKKVYPRFR